MESAVEDVTAYSVEVVSSGYLLVEEAADEDCAVE